MINQKMVSFPVYTEKDPLDYVAIPFNNLAVLVDMSTELDFPCVIKSGNVETLNFCADIFIAFAVAPVNFMVVELIPDKDLLEAIYAHTFMFGDVMSNLDVNKLPFFITGVSRYS